MDFLLRIIAMVCVVYSLYTYSRLMINIVSGFMELRRVDASPYQGIKCKNLSYKVQNYVISIFFEVLLIYCFIRLYRWSESVDIEWTMWIYRLLILVQILSILAHVIVAFYDDFAYVTPQGIVHITGVMRPEDCRYTWEECEEGLSSNLLVYKGKQDSPFRFQVLDRLEVAHEVVKGYKVNKPS